MTPTDEYPYKGDAALAAFLMSIIERGFSVRRAQIFAGAMLHDDYPNRSRILEIAARSLAVTKEELIELGAQVKKSAERR